MRSAEGKDEGGPKARTDRWLARMLQDGRTKARRQLSKGQRPFSIRCRACNVRRPGVIVFSIYQDDAGFLRVRFKCRACGTTALTGRLRSDQPLKLDYLAPYTTPAVRREVARAAVLERPLPSAE